MANFTYALGPWIKRTQGEMSYWDAPDHANGRICFSSLPNCAISPNSTDNRPIGFFCFEPDYSPSLDYLVLGKGDCREIKPSDDIRNSVAKLMTVKPEGDTITDWLGYWLFEGGDPTGQERWKLGTPTREGEYEIHLAGHSKVWSAKFGGTADARWNRLRDLLRADLREHDANCKAEAKRLKDEAKELRKQGKTGETDKCDARGATVENHAEKVLDAMSRKYRCLPSELSTDIRRGRARTTIEDAFSSSLTGWTTVSGTWGTGDAGGGNYRLRKLDYPNVWKSVRNDTAMSSADHYAQGKQYAGGKDGANFGFASRFSSSAETAYFATSFYGSGTGYKCVSSSVTYLGASSDTTWSTGSVIRSNCSGTTIQAIYYGAVTRTYSATDSAISGNLQGGAFDNGQYNSREGQYNEGDDFYATDGLAAANPKSPFGGIMLDGPFRRNVF